MIVYTCFELRKARSELCRIDTGRCLSCRWCESHCLNGEEDETEEGPPTPTPPPTKALPGSEAKLFILMWRAELGLALWNPNDAAAE